MNSDLPSPVPANEYNAKQLETVQEDNNLMIAIPMTSVNKKKRKIAPKKDENEEEEFTFKKLSLNMDDDESERVMLWECNNKFDKLKKRRNVFTGCVECDQFNVACFKLIKHKCLRGADKKSKKKNIVRKKSNENKKVEIKN